MLDFGKESPETRILTVVNTRGHTAASLTVDVADILLQAGVGSTAFAVWYRAACVLRHGVGDREGGDGEDDGKCELHCCGCFDMISKGV